MQESESLELMTESLDLIVRALNLLDQADAPADIGAHIDLARERLSSTLERARIVRGTASRSAA